MVNNTKILICKKIKIIGIVLIIIMFMLLIEINVNAINAKDNLISEETIADLSIEGDFSDNQILVVMDTDISKIDKIYSLEDFPTMDIESIDDLTPLQFRESTLNSIFF